MLRACLAVVVLAACSSPAAPPKKPVPQPKTRPAPAAPTGELLKTPLPGDPLAATIHHLSNGMTVYISTSREKPSINAWIAVRTGSRNDPKNSTGLAHYLEHMLFKGTGRLGTMNIEQERPHLQRIAELYKKLREVGPKQRKSVLKEIDAETQKSAAHAVPNELDRLYAALGVRGVNAFTSEDQTVYISEVPSNRFAHWAEVEAERYGKPEFRLFFPELESVYEEKNQSMDNPDWRVAETLARELYPRHPYGQQTTIGTVEHLKVPAYADMVDYFHRWYRPSNMAIVLAGDTTPEEALPVLEQTFGSLAAGRVDDPPAADLAGPSGRVERTIQAEGQNAVTLGWRTVGTNHVDRDAIEVMDLLVDNARTGLLNVDLLLSQKLPSAGSGPHFLREGGSWALFGTARDGQSHEEVETLLLSVVEKLKAGQFSEEDLKAVVVNEEIRQQRAMESNSSRVQWMTQAFIARTPWKHATERLARLRRVTKADVIRVAKTYLGENRVVVKRVRGKHTPPSIEKPSITPLAIDTKKQSPFAQSILAKQATPLEPRWLKEGDQFTRHDLPGAKLVAAKNTRNELAEVVFLFEIGFRKQKLLCHALTLLGQSGAGDTSAADLQRRLYAMGTQIDTACDSDSASVSIRALDRNLEASVKQLVDWLRAPLFDKETLKQLTANVISKRKDQSQDPRFQARALGQYASRGGASRYLAAPSNKSLTRARPKELRRLLGKLFDWRHRVTYYGPRSGDDVSKILSLGENHKNTPRLQPVRYRKQKRPTIYFVHQSTAQSSVYLQYRHVPENSPRARALSGLLSQYMGGGMAGLVFQEIREARGLAYSAFAALFDNARTRDEAMFFGFLGTQVDKTNDALAAMLDLFTDFRVDPARFASAKAALQKRIRATRPTPRLIGRQVFGWDDLGLTEDPAPKRFKELNALQPADLEAFARKLLSKEPVLAIAGNRKKINFKALKERYSIVELLPRNLMSY